MKFKTFRRVVVLFFARKIFEKFTAAFFIISALIFALADCQAQTPLQIGKKVLVVMSYHQGYQGGEKEIKEELDKLLDGAELKYFYLDTKNNPQEGPQLPIGLWMDNISGLVTGTGLPEMPAPI